MISCVIYFYQILKPPINKSSSLNANYSVSSHTCFPLGAWIFTVSYGIIAYHYPSYRITVTYNLAIN
jgi:hypothetical protein